MMPANGKAIVKDTVFYCRGKTRRPASHGEYEIRHRDGCVGLCNCSSRDVFVLSTDDYFQHLHEGRITLIA